MKRLSGLGITISLIICLSMLTYPLAWAAEEEDLPGPVVVKEREPDEGGGWYDEYALHPQVIEGVTRYFIKVTFADPHGTLAFNELNGLTYLKNSLLFTAGGSETSLIDQEFLNHLLAYKAGTQEQQEKYRTYRDQYIFTKDSAQQEATLYIPIKRLRSQTSYTVLISPNIVYATDVIGENSGNELLTWTFETMPVPLISAVCQGSVGEDYDADVPIYIKGDYFNRESIRVYFNNIAARRVYLRQNGAGEHYLEVYLPEGRQRLDPGLYEVTVQNDAHHERLRYGALSVVPEGEEVPNGQYHLKDTPRYGQVQGDLRVSRDTLYLKSSYTDRSRLVLDLDDLMGPEVWMRQIQFEGRRRDRIGRLETTSRWADVTLWNVSADFKLRLGRAEPLLATTLQSKLRGVSVKSDFIAVEGADFEAQRLMVSLPYRNSSGYRLQALRYDTATRSWYEEPFMVDQVEQKVIISSNRPGIFVVVE